MKQSMSDETRERLHKGMSQPSIVLQAFKVIPRKKDESASLRALEIGQMRILARKHPREFRKIAEEIVDAAVKI